MLFKIDNNLRRSSGIYKIVNSINGKIYIGSASAFTDRFRQHKSLLAKGTHTNQNLQRAADKYGLSVFVFEIVEVCDKSLLIDREQYWIDFFDVIKTGYNCAPFAGGTRGHTMPKESVIKRNATRKASGWVVGENQRELMSKRLKGRKFSPETIEKMRIAAKLRMSNPSVKEKMIRSKVGKRLTEEHKSKISLGVKKFKLNS